MFIYIVLRGEKCEGGTIMGVFTNKMAAIAKAADIREDPSFMKCDYVEIETWEVDEGMGAGRQVT